MFSSLPFGRSSAIRATHVFFFCCFPLCCGFPTFFSPVKVFVGSPLLCLKEGTSTPQMALKQALDILDDGKTFGIGWKDKEGKFAKLRVFSTSGRVDTENFVFCELQGYSRKLVEDGEWEWWLRRKHKEVVLTPQQFAFLENLDQYISLVLE